MQDNKQQSEHVYFVNQLYRDFLLPTILGEDNEAILYWAGKKVARKYNLSSFEDVVSFFAITEFGKLVQLKQRHSETVFELSGQSVTDRLNAGSREFSLEAGILAETIQKETGRTTECELKIDNQRKTIQITAKFD